MVDYRRAYLKGGAYFFTVVTYDRKPLLIEQSNLLRLRQAFRYVREKLPFQMDSIVVLPDHLHCIWRLPEGDDDFSVRWRMIKHYVARGIGAKANERREKTVWQRRFWEHCIRDEKDLRRHMDYIHYNPVKHGLVARVKDWPYSSFHRLVQQAYYDECWGEAEGLREVRNWNFE